MNKRLQLNCTFFHYSVLFIFLPSHLLSSFLTLTLLFRPLPFVFYRFLRVYVTSVSHLICTPFSINRSRLGAPQDGLNKIRNMLLTGYISHSSLLSSFPWHRWVSLHTGKFEAVLPSWLCHNFWILRVFITHEILKIR